MANRVLHRAAVGRLEAPDAPGPNPLERQGQLEKTVPQDMVT